MTWEQIQQKLQGQRDAAEQIRQWQAAGDTVVFTNGCFDLLHYGHVRYLADAKDLGQRLVVGLNGADSVARLKGPGRPINDEVTRQLLLASMGMIDLVVVFEDDTPLELIRLLQPDILVKGGDWKPEQIVGSELVLARGGQVRSIPYVEGYSTTLLEAKIRKQNH
jgi:rfaE bifunctional protein nucleotidyltransferase chain/domain